METTKSYRELEISLGTILTNGIFRHAQNSKGLIVFSHGSGSRTMSLRNNYVADLMLKRGFSSLLFDLLTTQEDTFYENRFDIPLLTSRLMRATEWIKNYVHTKHLSIGYFGTSTGAACALNAAAQLGNKIKAVVARGGRPDLALPILRYVKSPTLLLVGSKDDILVDSNIKAQEKISGICDLKIIEGATNLFSESGKLEIVVEESCDWYDTYL